MEDLLLVVGDCFNQENPSRWARIILKVNGYAYTKKVLNWWNTQGLLVHGKDRAAYHIAGLKYEMSEFIKIHSTYHKRIVFHFKNGVSFTVKLLDEKGIPIYIFMNNNSGVEFESFPINRDRKPFTSLSRIIHSIENVYGKSIDRIEIKENTNGSSKN